MRVGNRVQALVIAASLFVMSIVPGGGPPAHAAAAGLPMLMGIYPQGNLFDAATISQLKSIDNWIHGDLPGSGITIAGTFMDLHASNPAWLVPRELGIEIKGVKYGAWVNGYVPFVNLMTTHTSYEIASGAYDSDIRNWALAFKDWASSGSRKAFLAPLPEMNGYWVPYSDVDYYKQAFWHIQEIFSDAGVPDESVSWVWAPNFVSIGRPGSAEYYPGNAAADVIGFSAYNYGSCMPGNPWQTYESLFAPALRDMRDIAPSKPIFITQTGVVSQGGDKNAWLRDTFAKLADFDPPAVRAILYFNYRQYEANLICSPADYRIDGFQGFLDALGRPESDFQYWAPGDPEWSSTVFTPGPQGTFVDVWPPHPFAGVDPEWYVEPVETLAATGITAGCGSEYIPAFGSTWDYYCPDRSVSRAEMSIFLLKGIHGSSYTPPNPDGSSPFGDLAGHWAQAWMEQLYDEGMTSGYPGVPPTFRPQNQVTRAEMSVFLLKAKYGPSYVAPVPTDTPFADAVGHWAERWIVQLAQEGITAGCGGDDFCPESMVNRAQMAVFLVRTFNLAAP